VIEELAILWTRDYQSSFLRGRPEETHLERALLDTRGIEDLAILHVPLMTNGLVAAARADFY